MSTQTQTPALPLLTPLMRALRRAVTERIALPDVDGMEIDERILMESNLISYPPEFSRLRPRGRR